MLELSERRSS